MNQTELTTIVEEASTRYPIAPITNPEQIGHEPLRHVIVELVKVGYPTTGVETYALPERQEPERRLGRKIWYSMRCAMAGTKRKSKLEEQEKNRLLLENVQLQYQWLKKALNVVDTALDRLRESYDKMSNYVIKTDTSLAHAKKFLDLQSIEINLAELRQLEVDERDDSEYQTTIMCVLGESARHEAQACVRKKIENLGRSISNYRQACVYVERLAEHYETVVHSTQRNLVVLEEIIQRAVTQRMDLDRTLSVYEGLTNNQVVAVQAVEFLNAVDTITSELKGNMEDVNTLFAEKGEAYANRPLPVPVPDPLLEQGRQEIAGLLERE